MYSIYASQYLLCFTSVNVKIIQGAYETLSCINICENHKIGYYSWEKIIIFIKNV